MFEHPLGLPLLRHWADVGGGPAYYGAVPGSSLVIRGIPAVYNYDYIEVREQGDISCRGGRRIKQQSGHISRSLGHTTVSVVNNPMRSLSKYVLQGQVLAMTNC